MSNSANAVKKGEVILETDYEVWSGDECLATTSHFTEAMHYAVVYASDGDYEVWKVTKQKERIL